jgi:hypothetical protein
MSDSPIIDYDREVYDDLTNAVLAYSSILKDNQVSFGERLRSLATSKRASVGSLQGLAERSISSGSFRNIARVETSESELSVGADVETETRLLPKVSSYHSGREAFEQ